jgi:hypothetical protein
MDFRTKVELPTRKAEIRHTDRILVMGSCFSEHIGRKLQEEKFRCMVNPYGALYNPIAIDQAIQEIIEGKPYHWRKLVQGPDGLWHSMMHHGSFSDADRKTCLHRINESLMAAHEFLKEADWLIVTLGSAYVYKYLANNQFVGNCHHFPAECFERERIFSFIVSLELMRMGTELRAFNPKLKILFTVSPIRHLKDGLHANQLSKAALIEGLDYCLKELEDAYYFPAYEILMDELRDYRFYADDMLHPSQVAVDYIWERFEEGYFSEDTLAILQEWDKVRLCLQHRPLHPESEQYRDFVRQNMLKLQQLREKFPYFELEKEIAQCEALLKEE